MGNSESQTLGEESKQQEIFDGLLPGGPPLGAAPGPEVHGGETSAGPPGVEHAPTGVASPAHAAGPVKAGGAEPKRMSSPVCRRAIPGRKLYQDEVYGTKELSPLAVALIDTPEFQRLSHIYQLGFTHAVFRGANHRRFDHSVGTYFMLRTLMRRIVQNHARFYSSDPKAFAHPGLRLSPRLYAEAPGTPYQWQRLYSPMGRWRGLTELVSAAGLLHDLGHMPVGHTLEDEFSVFEKHDSLGGSRMFEMFYGPRKPVESWPSGDWNGAPRVERYFSAIDVACLPRPEAWERVPLPWVFEDGTYERFFPDIQAPTSPILSVPALSNWEVRDLIYLILSFKETITADGYRTFEEELAAANGEAAGNGGTERMLRLKFIDDLYDYYSRTIDLGREHEALPLFYPFMADIVGNTICADLLDYLVRDGKRLKLEIRDNPRLQRYLVIRPESSFVQPAATSSRATEGPGSLRVTINAVYRKGLRRRDTVSDLLDLMRERYRFAEVVYYHPKKAALSTMLAKALELYPKKTRPRDGDGIYPAPWSGDARLSAAAPHVAHFGDEGMLAYLSHGGAGGPEESSAAALVRRIAYRDEYRLLFTLDYEAADAAGGPLKFIKDLRSRDGAVLDAGRKRMENLLARLVRRSSPSEWSDDRSMPVLIYCPNIRMQVKEVAARVELIPERVVPLNRQKDDPTLENEIFLLNQKYQRLWRLYLFVHPRLAHWGAWSSQEAILLSTIIDAFCHPYGVTENHRQRGCRYEYVPFPKRIDKYLREWIDNLPVGRPHEEIRARAEGLALWTTLVSSSEAPFPANEHEYYDGLTLAAVTVAADQASPRQKEQWPEELRFLKQDEWHTPAAVARVEESRKLALKRLVQIGESLLSNRPASKSPSTWESFAELVALGLKSN